MWRRKIKNQTHTRSQTNKHIHTHIQSPSLWFFGMVGVKINDAGRKVITSTDIYTVQNIFSTRWIPTKTGKYRTMKISASSIYTKWQLSICRIIPVFLQIFPSKDVFASGVAHTCSWGLPKKGIENLQHLPYSLDLAPADFFLFLKVKNALCGIHNKSIRGVNKGGH